MCVVLRVCMCVRACVCLTLSHAPCVCVHARIATHTKQEKTQQTSCAQCSTYRICHGQQAHLHRTQPEGEISRRVLHQDTKEPLEGTKNGTVNHDGAFLGPIVGDILQVKAFRQVKIALDRRALP